MSKVRQDDAAPFLPCRHEYVVRLDVTVRDSIVVEVVNCLEQLPDDHSCFRIIHMSIRLGVDVRKQVASLDQLLHDVDVMMREENLLNGDDVGVDQAFENLVFLLIPT